MIDLIDGYPSEQATVEQIADFYVRNGLDLERLLKLSTDYGCNEFVLERIAEAGVR